MVMFLLAACVPGDANEPAVADSEPGGGAGTPAPTLPLPTADTGGQAVDPECNILWSRLRVGMSAYVTYGDRANRVRSEPSKGTGEIIAYIYPGTVVEVLEGPVCADNLVYWRVAHSSLPGGSGWTAEGNGVWKRWLNPSNCASDVTGIYRHHAAFTRPEVRGLRVYDQSGSDGVMIGSLDGDVPLQVIGGPYCTDNTADKLVYWQVAGETIPGGTGWVSEYGTEDGQFYRYLAHNPTFDPTAFPLPPSLASLTPAPATSSGFPLSELALLGRIAYIHEGGIWLVDADGSDARQLLGPVAGLGEPNWLAWSRDGAWLVSTVDMRMFVIATEDGQASEPRPGDAFFAMPAFSPDGSQIAYAQGGFGDIFVVGRDGSNTHKINSDATQACTHPVWSPYGRYVAYVCYDSSSHLYISDSTSGTAGVLSAMGQDLAWSPDGNWIAFNDYEEGLSILKSDGSSSRLLIPEPVDSFAWSPDSSTIAITDSDQVYLVTIADSQVRNLSGHVVTAPYNWVRGSVSWSPDGGYVVYAFQSYLFDEGYWRISPVFISQVESGARQQLVDQGTLPLWSPVRTSLIVQHPDCTSNWTRLEAGGVARLLGEPGDPPNRVRSGPSTADENLFQIYPGAVLDLIEGPVCSNGLVFWKIEVMIDGQIQTGWTAEGDGNEYWLEPYTP
jgi:hypothetical protein